MMKRFIQSRPKMFRLNFGFFKSSLLTKLYKTLFTNNFPTDWYLILDLFIIHSILFNYLFTRFFSVNTTAIIILPFLKYNEY